MSPRGMVMAAMLAALLAGCASAPSPAPEREPSPPTSESRGEPVVGPRWQLILLGTDEHWSGDEPAYIEVVDEGGHFQLTGSNGCNRLRGEVELDDGNRFRVSDLASTRRACPNTDQAGRVDEMLGSAYRYLIDGDRLVLFGRDSRVLGGFERR
ncbi:META domain-containing protein [Aidingimonas lacisalsi]|uniref:META domain-containing protein n=1 Tax=Aidingimonas lacisalsi TaxID=2604086 RepID=UPI0011D250C7|nr:META domain-containing protein [Aidingimonas lacisalsi]